MQLILGLAAIIAGVALVYIAKPAADGQKSRLLRGRGYFAEMIVGLTALTLIIFGGAYVIVSLNA